MLRLGTNDPVAVLEETGDWGRAYSALVDATARVLLEITPSPEDAAEWALNLGQDISDRISR